MPPGSPPHLLSIIRHLENPAQRKRPVTLETKVSRDLCLLSGGMEGQPISSKLRCHVISCGFCYTTVACVAEELLRDTGEDGEAPGLGGRQD